MKKLIASFLVFTISSQAFAAKVCSHQELAQVYPREAARLGNCPSDTPAGFMASCLDSDGVTVRRFFCDSLTGWHATRGYKQVVDDGDQEILEEKIEAVE